MAGFFSQLGVSAGQALIAGQQLDAQQASTDLKKAEVAESKSRMAALTQQTETRKAVGNFISAKMAEDKASVDDPAKAATFYSQASAMALSRGDFTTAHEMDTLAQDKLRQSKERRVEVAADIQMKRENLGRTAMQFANSGTMADATEVFRAAVNAGVNPMDIPKPNTPEFKAWAKAQEVSGMSSKEQHDAQEKVREFEEKEQQRKAEAEDRTRQRELDRQARADSQREARALRAQIAEATQEERAARRDTREGETAFRETEKLNGELQKAADPLLKDRTTVTNVKNLLNVDSPVADQQIREALPALLGGLKGRATGAYYKDNKTFGDVVQRLSGFASQTFTGRYDEQTRKQLFTMLDSMEKGVLDPGLTRIEKDAKDRAKKYKLDDDLITIQGDFTRREPKAAAGSAAAAGLPAAGTTKTINGVTYKSLGGGKWEQQ